MHFGVFLLRHHGIGVVMDPTLDASTLVLNILLYVLLPLWVVAGGVDWFCHRATNIESTAGLREALVHAIMGVQVGIPILLGLLFEVNVLVLILCILAFVAHELVAHYDVKYAQDLREISIWEVHAHSYLATLPFFILLLIVVRRWETFIDFITLNWAGGMTLEWRQESLGMNGNFAVSYMAVMLVFGVLPYLMEIYRCWKWERDNGVSTLPWGNAA